MHLPRSLRTPLAVAVAAASALPLVVAAQAEAAPAAGSAAVSVKRHKTLVIGIDGATFAKFDKARMPVVKGLMADGMTATSNLYAAPMAPTLSGPLRGSLQSAVDETALPSTLKGWTHTAPTGWSIDNSAMPSGGVSEWRGWAFATDEFWSNTDLGQGREGNVRARDVFAVADSDEWDDKAHGAGPFDSTLISPAFPVTGGAPATVSYVTDYRVDGPQTGEVSVSFDGGAPQLLKSYGADLNGVESLPVAVPAGASTARLRFRYTGTNSSFWTVDQVTVSP
ncbi:hypothetical protein AB0K51_14065 [Kitasatospora sp. NPDC049285]|uniref:hypothetical protein n=1 Tax=Kitasatospora sp. NPDC049285 TaxID=3157096 RepID=UPI003437E813